MHNDDYNCYVGTTGETEEEARAYCRDTFHGHDGQPMKLVHREEPEEEEEQTTWIFSFQADVVDEDGDMDRLHDLYDLPNLPNLPIEIV
jgi:hypothetical protein